VNLEFPAELTLQTPESLTEQPLWARVLATDARHDTASHLWCPDVGHGLATERRTISPSAWEGIDQFIDQPRLRRAMPDSMRIKIGDIFRDSEGAASGQVGQSFPTLRTLTRGRHRTGINAQHGMWKLSMADRPGEFAKRIPALVWSSNPFSGNVKNNPWLDVIEPEDGYALYNGDNKSSKKEPFAPLGNKTLWSVAHLYADSPRRREAPPVLLFRKVPEGGKTSGFSEFCGYGVPIHLSLRTQREQKGKNYFVNLVVELCLFDLLDDTGREGELDWGWIDDLREPDLPPERANEKAPIAWKRWVDGADPTSCRRRAFKPWVATKKDQAAEGDSGPSTVSLIHDHYAAHPHRFEGLAARVAAQIIGDKCERRWVTRASRDGGVDFVCFLHVGDVRNRTGVVVLGQAKCVSPKTSIGPTELARLVARLRRGWIGVFVTTGIFTDQAQKEVLSDNYPLLLIPGKAVDQEVNKILNHDKVSLDEFLRQEEMWYKGHIRHVDASRAAEEINLGVEVKFPRVSGSKPDVSKR